MTPLRYQLDATIKEHIEKNDLVAVRSILEDPQHANYVKNDADLDDFYKISSTRNYVDIGRYLLISKKLCRNANIYSPKCTQALITAACCNYIDFLKMHIEEGGSLHNGQAQTFIKKLLPNALKEAASSDAIKVINYVCSLHDFSHEDIEPSMLVGLKYNKLLSVQALEKNFSGSLDAAFIKNVDKIINDACTKGYRQQLQYLIIEHQVNLEPVMDDLKEIVQEFEKVIAFSNFQGSLHKEIEYLTSLLDARLFKQELEKLEMPKGKSRPTKI